MTFTPTPIGVTPYSIFSSTPPTLTFSFFVASLNISANARWTHDGTTVAGGNGDGNEFNQLSYPVALYVDDDQNLYIADAGNERIVKWKCGATSGHVVAGGNGRGNGNDQLNYSRDVIVDKRADSFIICDNGNQRVMRWPRRCGEGGQTIISNVTCVGLAMDDNGFLYISDSAQNEVRRWRVGETNGAVVAGANGEGDRLDQLNSPGFIFVDRNHSVYVSDYENHRVMKWMKGAKEGIVVAGGRGQGDALTQINGPDGIVVDQLGTVYVADFNNHRITRWPKGATEGSILVGGNGQGEQPNQFSYPMGLSFDRQGNLYVVDHWNHRVQKFSLIIDS